MSDPLTGGCACGAVRYECSGAPRYMGNCHCRDCQRATGSGYAPLLLVKENELTVSGREPGWFEKAADRGHTMRRGFCPGHSTGAIQRCAMRAAAISA